MPAIDSNSVRAARAAPSVGPLSEFFTHHGLWAPGVRLFRNLGFPAKAAIITLACIRPANPS